MPVCSTYPAARIEPGVDPVHHLGGGVGGRSVAVQTPGCRYGRSDWREHGGPQGTAKHAETRSAVGAVAAADHTRSGAEQRARTTAAATLAAAQNGTSDILEPSPSQPTRGLNRKIPR